MAYELKILRGRVGRPDDVTDEQPMACSCPTCVSSAPKAAKGSAPEPPSMIDVIRKEQAAPATAAIDRNQAPPPPDLAAILKQGDRQ